MKRLLATALIILASISLKAQILDSAIVLDASSPSSVEVYGAFASCCIDSITNISYDLTSSADTAKLNINVRWCISFPAITPFDTVYTAPVDLTEKEILMIRSFHFNPDSSLVSCQFQPVPVPIDTLYLPLGTTNVAEIKISERITVYPNPVKGNLILKTPTDLALREIKLYDLKGRLVREFPSGQRNFDVSSLPSGLYCLVLRTESYGLITEKVVIE